MKMLEAQLIAAGAPVRPQTLERLYAFYQLLEEGNKHANLTSISGWESVRDELIVRSFPLAHLLNSAQPGARLIDIGTGAGVPGLVIKIVYPHLEVALIDATRKKIDFLTAAIDALDLKEVTAIHARAEDLAHHQPYRESYDFAVARALGSLSEIAELLLPFVAVGGTAAALKTAGVDGEAAQAAFAASQMGGEPAVLFLVERQGMDTPGDGPADTLVTWRKATPTPERYPRRAGVPHKTPLAAPASHSTTAKVSGE
ncbi:MAG: 16S rRNA (guanine(527)-N(7))-methyltransferase RsmG [Chloroflexi bacterium]|nr:16S rRNA (guanine(527)-N(7))-methyltransferase RsmG [Chloroflexota bacterium]